MELVLRPTEDRDLASITAIYRHAVLTGVATYELDPPDQAEMADRWRALSAGGHPHIVAAEGDAVLGYAYAGPYRARPAYRFTVEDSIYIAPEAQGQGIGKALLGELLALSEAGGFRQMIAAIGGNSAASIALHLALGFRHVGVLEGSGFKHGRWLDTVLMQRPLGAGTGALPDEAKA